jgi:hypothetical protein
VCFYCGPDNDHGDFVLARNGAVLTSKAKRDGARSRPCGRRGAMCAVRGLVERLISAKLYLRLIQSCPRCQSQTCRDH